MADDGVDLRFLGRQVQVLQGDVRDLRSNELRRDAELAAVRTDLSRTHAETNAKFEQVDDRFDRLEREVRNGFAAVDDRFGRLEQQMNARFEQAHLTMATNLMVVLEAIKNRL